MLLGAYLAGEAHVELQAEPSEPSPNLTFETTRNPSNTRPSVSRRQIRCGNELS